MYLLFSLISLAAFIQYLAALLKGLKSLPKAKKLAFMPPWRRGMPWMSPIQQSIIPMEVCGWLNSGAIARSWFYRKPL